MKAMFVFPSSGGGYGINEYTEQPPLGIAYLASVLEKEGFSVEVLDANFSNYGVREMRSFILKSDPDILCLSLYAFNFKSGAAVADAVKERVSQTLIITGGAQPSALGEKIFEETVSFDAAVIGEGESTILEIAERLNNGLDPFGNVDGVIYRNGKDIMKNRPRQAIQDLDSLPFPAFHLYPNLSRYHRRAIASPAVPILTSRGCPFECVFCSRSVFGRHVRYRSSENVIAEVDFLVKNFGIRQLDIVDDNFITDKERAIKILEELKRKPYRLSINLQSGVSAVLIDRKMLRLMKDSGVYRIAFGVESGNQDILDRIKKRQRLEDIVRAVSLAKEAGIQTDAFFIVGLPGDSSKTMQDTIDFAKRIDPHTANFHMAVPFPGTELYAMVKHSGRLLRETREGIRSGYNYPEAFYELGNLKKEDVEKYYKKAYREFYFRPEKILKTIINIRSFEELTWLLKTAGMVVASIFKKRRNREAWGDEELDLLARLVWHPIFGLLYRHRYRMALSLVEKSERLLEIGCGHGFFLPMLSKRASMVYGADIHPYLGKVKDAPGNVVLNRADILHLPYKDRSFDSIVCLSTLEHMTDIESAVGEIDRVLTKKGRLVVGFPVKNVLTRALFSLVGRDDFEIHPQSHSSVIAALNRAFTVSKVKIFPAFLPVNMGLYFVGRCEKDDR